MLYLSSGTLSRWLVHRWGSWLFSCWGECVLVVVGTEGCDEVVDNKPTFCINTWMDTDQEPLQEDWELYSHVQRQYAEVLTDLNDITKGQVDARWWYHTHTQHTHTSILGTSLSFSFLVGVLPLFLFCSRIPFAYSFCRLIFSTCRWRWESEIMEDS